MEQEDTALADLGGEFALTRNYNSKGADQVSMFGRGWSFEYERSLTQMEDGDIFYTRGDGGYLYFARNEDGSYTLTNPEGSLARSASDGGCPDGYTLTDSESPLARSAPDTVCPEGTR